MLKNFILTLTMLINFAYASEKLTNADVKDAAMAYGYYQSQNYSLDKIIEKYPNLTQQAMIAKIGFDSKHKETIRHIDITLSKIDKQKWENIKTASLREAKKYLSIDNLSFEQATNFIEEVKERANGKIQSPFLESLLLFNPRYINNPVLEFTDGYTYTYENNGSNKSKGVSFKIKIPNTWKASEAERPNIVQKFTEKNGRGSAIFMILVKNLPEIVEPTKEDIKELLSSSKEISEFIPDNGKLLDAGHLILEGHNGFWIKYKMKVERGRTSTLEIDSIQYMVFYKDKMIAFQGMVPSSINGENILNNSFIKYEPLFDMIINSFVLSDLYKIN